MNYSILVNTCDKFEDCWNPFFILFKKYWPEYKGLIYLNTEFKDYSFEGLNVVPIKGCVGKEYPGKFATWSQCLFWALDAIDTDIVLYMQEDYFLKKSVVDSEVNKLVQLMVDKPDIACIHLTDQGVVADGTSKYPGLNKVKLKQKYRVSCQAALWRKEELLRIIRTYESAWEFEEFGSKRSTILKSNYYVVDGNVVKKDVYEIIPYIFTGIVQGQWIPEAKDLFEQNDITIDYSIRGFLVQPSILKRVIVRLKKIPNMLRNQRELRKLKRQMK